MASVIEDTNYYVSQVPNINLYQSRLNQTTAQLQDKIKRQLQEFDAKKQDFDNTVGESEDPPNDPTVWNALAEVLRTLRDLLETMIDSIKVVGDTLTAMFNSALKIGVDAADAQKAATMSQVGGMMAEGILGICGGALMVGSGVLGVFASSAEAGELAGLSEVPDGINPEEGAPDLSVGNEPAPVDAMVEDEDTMNVGDDLDNGSDNAVEQEARNEVQEAAANREANGEDTDVEQVRLEARPENDDIEGVQLEVQEEVNLGEEPLQVQAQGDLGDVELQVQPEDEIQQPQDDLDNVELQVQQEEEVQQPEEAQANSEEQVANENTSGKIEDAEDKDAYKKEQLKLKQKQISKKYEWAHKVESTVGQGLGFTVLPAGGKIAQSGYNAASAGQKAASDVDNAAVQALKSAESPIQSFNGNIASTINSTESEVDAALRTVVAGSEFKA